MNVIIIAWKNIWRNKRRTLITTASVMFAVFFAILMRSVQDGAFNRTLDNIIQMHIGHLQIHARGYWDDKSPESLFEYNNTIEKAIADIPHVQKIYKRLETFAFISTGEQTKVAAFMGVEPEVEYRSLNVKHTLILGSFITGNDSAIVLSEGLAYFLKVITYDTIITKQQNSRIDTIIKPRFLQDSVAVISRGYRGESAAAMFRVKGIVKLLNPDLNKRMVYAPLKVTQSFLSAPNMLSSLAMVVESKDEVPTIKGMLKKQLNQDEYEVMTWDEMMQEYVQLIESKRSSGTLMMLILYALIGFGIFGTVVMLTNERRKEFAVMVSIGMRKTRLITTVLFELFYMGILEIFAGMLLSLPILAYWFYHPIRFYGETARAIENYGWEAILPVEIRIEVFIWQAITVLILFGISAFFPINRIRKMDVVKTIRE
jgi:putative ABC transport system permease protein